MSNPQNPLAAFQGAADVVFGFANMANRQRAADLEAENAGLQIMLGRQQIDFNAATMPLRADLLREQVAAANLMTLTNGFNAYQVAQDTMHTQRARMATSKALASFSSNINDWRISSLANAAPDAGLPLHPNDGPTFQPFSPLADPTAPAGPPAPAQEAGRDGTQQATGLDLGLPTGPTGDAVFSLLPPLGAETGGVPQSAPPPPAPSQEPSLAESEFVAFRKSGAGFFSPSSPPPPEPMGPPAARPQASQPATASTAAQPTDGAAQSQAAAAGSPWSLLKPPVPPQREMALVNRLKAIVAGAGGLEALHRQAPEWSQSITEWSQALQSSPALINYSRQVERYQNARDVLGKVVAYGLDPAGYAPVLEMIQSGVSVDTAALAERLKADHAAMADRKKAEQAANLERDKMLFEKRLGASNVLTALSVQNPALEPIVSIGTNFAAGLPKERGDVLKTTLSDQLARGDTGSAIDLLKQTAKEVAQAPEVKRLTDTSAMLDAIKDASATLTELYEQKGKGATGPLVGRSLSDWTSDPKLRGYKSRLDVAQQAYQQAISGASVTEQEAQRLRDMFPSITKEKELNDSQIKELEKAMTAKKAAAEMDVYGPKLKELIDNRVIPTGSQSQSPIQLDPSLFASPEAQRLYALGAQTFKSMDEAVAAGNRGAIKPGEQVLINIGGKFHPKFLR